jgi:hypothetical protein
MSKQNTNPKKTQIIDELKRDYFSMIPQIERNWTPDQHEKNRLSRSLAAFAIANLADVTPAQAANSIINGENDNGIDAVYFDRIKNLLWIVQSKAGNAPNMGDNKKLCDGIRDLINKRFQKFNAGFSRLQQDVEDALDTNRLKIVGCNVYLDGNIGSHVVNDLNQLQDELNKFINLNLIYLKMIRRSFHELRKNLLNKFILLLNLNFLVIIKDIWIFLRV